MISKVMVVAWDSQESMPTMHMERWLNKGVWGIIQEVNYGERLAQTITGIWTEIVHNVRGSLDNIKGYTQRAKLQRLKIHAILSVC